MVFIIGQEYLEGHEILSRSVVSVSAVSDFKLTRKVDNSVITTNAMSGGEWKPLFKSNTLEDSIKIMANILEKHSHLSELQIIDVDSCLTSPADIVNSAITSMCNKLVELGHEQLVEAFYTAMEGEMIGETLQLEATEDDITTITEDPAPSDSEKYEYEY